MMSGLKPKTVAESAVRDQVYKVFMNDLNANHTVFGGLVMSQLDRTASVVAERHSGHTCVTASVDALHFLAPAHEGDVLIAQASVNKAWNSSMEIGVRVSSENPKTGEREHIVSAYFTFVAINDHGKPVPVPELIPETTIEKRRYADAEVRREVRKREAKIRRERHAQEESEE
jgi:acyl-CoA hydrolase